jgi:hypothetical protein
MTIANDQVPDADEVLRITKIDQVYTGSGFNSSASSAAPVEEDHELDAVSSTDLTGNVNYAVLTITGKSTFSSNNTGPVTTQLKAQIKETGDSYADIEGYTIVHSTVFDGTTTYSSTYKLVATLTAGMKTNGFQIKVFSKSTGTSTRTASFVNIQTVLEVKP